MVLDSINACQNWRPCHVITLVPSSTIPNVWYLHAVYMSRPLRLLNFLVFRSDVYSVWAQRNVLCFHLDNNKLSLRKWRWLLRTKYAIGVSCCVTNYDTYAYHCLGLPMISYLPQFVGE